MKSKNSFLFNNLSLIVLLLLLLLYSGCTVDDTTPVYGSIQVNSIPAGAKIYLDDADTGFVTPHLLDPVVEGIHYVQLELYHYRTQENRVLVTGGETTVENINLDYIAEQEWITQPGVEGKDTFVTEREPSYNYDPFPYIYVGKNSIYEYRSYVEFDLSSFPEDAVPIDASVSLYYHSSSEEGDRIEIGVHRVAGEWREEVLTWNMQPAYNPTPQGILMITDYATKKYYSWDITDLVEGWLSGTTANHGVMFKVNSFVEDGHWVKFVSSDFLAFPKPPKLTITYFLP